jgi:predicted amidohydrolase
MVRVKIGVSMNRMAQYTPLAYYPQGPVGGCKMPDFKIAAAQAASVRGDIDGNIATHAAALAAAAEHEVSVLVFPELSLTGYEPDLAAELAITEADSRLAPLLALARHHRMEVIVGAPLPNGKGKPALGAILITASGTTRTYRKMHLGSSEQAYFAPGDMPLAFTVSGHTLGIAICADSSQPAHPQAYADLGASIYAAGVFLNTEWYATDAPRLAAYAARYRMLVIMANHAASVGIYTSVGKSAVWAPGGARLAQAAGVENALVIATSKNGAWRGEVIRF